MADDRERYDRVHATLMHWGFDTEARDLAAQTTEEGRRAALDRYARCLAAGREGVGPFGGQMNAIRQHHPDY